MKDINLRLREIRRSRNLSQEELAEKLGVSRQAIIALEQGASLPSLPVLLALMRVLDLPFPRLFNEQWQPFRQPDFTDTDATGLSAFTRNQDQTIRVLLTENNSALTVYADLPGTKEEDITIDLSQQHVLIMATRKNHNTDNETIHVEELMTGPVARILSLPCPIDTNKAEALFENGVLKLSLPKFLPETKRRITFSPTKGGSRGSK